MSCRKSGPPVEDKDAILYLSEFIYFLSVQSMPGGYPKNGRANNSRSSTANNSQQQQQKKKTKVKLAANFAAFGGQQ